MKPKQAGELTPGKLTISARSEEIGDDVGEIDAVKEANPETIICVGIGVFDVLGEDFNHLCNNVHLIPAPNAFLPSEEHLCNWRKYREICQGQEVSRKSY